MTASFFGRSTDFWQLEDVLTRVTTGTAGFAFIEGEPGIGKSALLKKATTRARELGFAVFAGRAEELEQDRPFRSIAEALDCTRADSDPRRSEIASLLGTASSDEAIFYKLIDAFEDLLEAESLRGQVLLTIDDLQWADAGTVGSLATIFRRMSAFPVAIFATMRHVPRSKELTALLRSMAPNAIRIALEPLDETSVNDLITERLGSAPDSRLRAYIDRAGGNPFYILELIDALAKESGIPADDTTTQIEDWALPPSLVVTILQRLTVLPKDVLEILRSAAVLGASFRIEDLATAAGVAHSEALAAVQTLGSHGVFTDDGEKIRFRHDLIREAVYFDLGEPVRVSMHRRIGHSLADAGAIRAEVIVHMMRGALPGDTEAADWMIEASEDPTLDFRTQIALIERALEINPGHPKRSPLVFRLATLLMWMAQPTDAILRLQRLHSQTSNVVERLNVTLWLMMGCWVAGRSRDMKSWAKQTSILARQLVHPDRVTILWIRSLALQCQGDLAGANVLCERAVALARETGHRRETQLNELSAFQLTMLCRPAEALERSQKALSLPEVSSAQNSANWRTHARALGDLDRIDEAETALGVARTIAEEKGLILLGAKETMESAHLRYLTGRWDDALVDAETAATISTEFHFAYDGPDPACILSWIAYRRNDGALVKRLRSERASDESLDRLWPTLLAVMAHDSGDVDKARKHASELLSQIAASPIQRRDFDLLPVLARIALAAGDSASARLGRDTAVLLTKGSDAPSVALADARCRAIVDGEVSSALRVIELARWSPRMLLAAEAFEDAATVLDREAAVEVLGEASDLYEKMGAIRDHARVAARLRGLGARTDKTALRAPTASGWDALTSAEVEVVRLAADGLTNREIGSRLFISHRTVETHLSHVFDKLGIRSRVALAHEAGQRFNPTTLD